MTLNKNNCYSFDECSIINQCEINILPAFLHFINANRLHFKNFHKLNKLSFELDRNKIPKYRFVPSYIQQNIIKAAEKLLSTQGNVAWLGEPFKFSIIKQLQEFFEDIILEYQEIQKQEDILSVQNMFLKNQRQLKRAEDIPEDDDCKIIEALILFKCDGIKYIISEDEHFWGYKDIILNELGITAVEEWRCDTLI